MSELIRLIDEYRDHHGQPSEASVARTLGVNSRALNAWRHRGVKELPKNREVLQRLAKLTGLPYAYILDCALYDAGWITEKPDPENYRKGRERGAG